MLGDELHGFSLASLQELSREQYRPRVPLVKSVSCVEKIAPAGTEYEFSTDCGRRGGALGAARQ